MTGRADQAAVSSTGRTITGSYIPSDDDIGTASSDAMAGITT
jgi:hypothetical protein